MRSRRIAAGFLALGGFLLLTALLGRSTILGHYTSGLPRSWERFDPAFAGQTPTYDSLHREAERRSGASLDDLSPPHRMKVLHDIVAERFTNHEARHTFFTNWILWTLSKIHPSFGRIWSVELLTSGGHSGFCDQVSYVLLHLALDSGIRARHVNLYGHVVMEAWYGDAWHLYDPDFEVVPTDPTGRVFGVEDLSRPKRARQFYKGPKESAAALIESTQDNTFVSYPIGARFEWKSQALSVFEQIAEILELVIPIGLLLSGAWLIRRHR